MTEAAILWRRLDTEGHDACRLVREADGWRLVGAAAFVEEGVGSAASYEVICDSQWRTRSARVHGWRGDAAFDITIESSSSGTWTLNGVPQPLVTGCVDVDLAFTPATNLLALRRLAPPLGGPAVPAPAAYLVFPDIKMDHLRQTYRRLDQARYAYTASVYTYDDILEVSEAGFVLDYPGLWKAVWQR